MISALVKDVGASAGVQFVDESLRGLQALVGGYLQAVPVAGGLTLLCDEDGLAKRLPFNVMVEGHRIHGLFLIVRSEDGEFVSITPEDAMAARELLSSEPLVGVAL